MTPFHNYDPPSLAMMGIHRTGLVHVDTDTLITQHSCEMLARTLNTGHVIAFVGSGLSIAAGYPSWDEIIEKIARHLLDLIFVTGSSPIALAKGGESVNLLCQHLVHTEYGKYRKPRKNQTNADHIAQFVRDLFSASRRNFGHNQQRCLTQVLKMHLAALTGNRSRVVDAKRFVADALHNPPAGVTPSELKLVVAESCKKWIDRYFDDRASPSDPESIEVAIDEVYRGVDRGVPSKLLVQLRDQLGIRRFITLNYDDVIERSVFPTSEHTSLSYNDKDMGKLVEFGFCGDPSVRVLHLHGQAQSHPNEDVARAIGREELVLAERDYQRTYLLDDEISRISRRAFESLLSSNSLLFLGTGMTEEDVLRPFRRFLTERRPGEVQRPLFALLPERETTLR